MRALQQATMRDQACFADVTSIVATNLPTIDPSEATDVQLEAIDTLVVNNDGQEVDSDEDDN